MKECVKQQVSSALSASVHWDRSQGEQSHVLSVPGPRIARLCVRAEVRWASFQSLLNGRGAGSKWATKREGGEKNEGVLSSEP